MIERIEAFVKYLTTTPGLCGAEQRVCEIMKREFAACGMSPKVDAFGNCMVEIPGTDPDAPVLMIFAHMDSLGFVVKYIDEQGFVKLERVGGIPEKALPNTQVQIGTRNGSYLDGVIGLKSHHLTPPEEKYIVDKYTSLFVDIGAKSREEVLSLGIDVGSPVVYKPKFTKLLGTAVLATYLDDRGGCTALLELAHTLTKTRRPSTIWLVASVLEEYNLRGAMLAARAIRPTMAICLDGGGPHDTPDLQGTGHLRMGGSPTMDLYNFHGHGSLNGICPIVKLNPSRKRPSLIATQMHYASLVRRQAVQQIQRRCAAQKAHPEQRRFLRIRAGIQRVSRVFWKLQTVLWSERILRLMEDLKTLWMQCASRSSWMLFTRLEPVCSRLPFRICGLLHIH